MGPHGIFETILPCVFRGSCNRPCCSFFFFFYLGQEVFLKALYGCCGVSLRDVFERVHVRAVTFEEETPLREMLPTHLGASLLTATGPAGHYISWNQMVTLIDLPVVVRIIVYG
jgi:hypothetical protein